MAKHAFQTLQHYLQQTILGQADLVEGLLLALLADGHILVEGPPGLAKTRAVKALGMALEGDFQRIQFTPDLLPADLTGTDIFRPETGAFEFKSGPLFHNVLLADEINRAPAKVQSALLEAMAEQQITVGNKTYPLPKLFLVMATQNPLEQEGTYPLPEAQLDRFLLKLELDYPGAETERQILHLNLEEVRGHVLTTPRPLSQADIFAARKQALEVHLAAPLEQYLVDLIIATRQPDRYEAELASWLGFGASPRATVALARCAKARAWLEQRDFVTPDDIQHCALPVLRHRLLLSYEAEAEGVTADQVIQRIIELVAVA